jgi:hypothetical protein
VDPNACPSRCEGCASSESSSSRHDPPPGDQGRGRRNLSAGVEKHFTDYAELLPDGQVFVGPTGVTPARPNFSPIRTRALTKPGLTGIHVHDLRHTGNHLAAISGASTRELMARMGHAALVYQHRTAARDRRLLTRSMRWCGRSIPRFRAVRGTLRARRLGSDRGSIPALVANVGVTRTCVVGADDGNRTRILSLGT